MSKVSSIPWQRALAEFLVIFAGITLSLAADDWRESRVEAQREIAALEGIRADLEEDSLDLAMKIGRAGDWDQASLWIQQNRGKSGLPPDSVVKSIQPLFFTHRYQPVRSTYVSLLSSGDLALLRDESVRKLIVSYYERRQPYMVSMEEGSVRFLEGFAEASRPLVLWTQDNPEATSIRKVEEGAWFELLQPWEAGSENLEFVSAATFLGIAGANIVTHFSNLIAENNALRSAITEYLRR